MRSWSHRVEGLARALVACLCAWIAVAASRASADELGVELMAEPAPYTDVIDAFEPGDPFDLNLRIGFSRSRATGTIQREVDDDASGDGAAFVDIAEHEHVVNQLVIGLDVGLYEDLMAYGRLPLILSDDRQLRTAGGRTQAGVAGDLTAPVPDAYEGRRVAGDEVLFEVPVDSATRSGVDQLIFGMAWAISNEYRSPHLPTWVVMAEGRFAVGPVLNPCIERGESPAGIEEGRDCAGGDGDPGISRGTHALRLETRVSRRFRYIEPYLGGALQLEWAGPAADRFAPGNDTSGMAHTQPPNRLELTAGATLVPWEDRGRHQRFAVDLRGIGAYIGEGRDYTPLFDALGTSKSAYLTAAQYARIPGMGEPTPEPVPFTGITDVSARARLGFRGAVLMKAARYVQFALGAGLYYDTPYQLTGADPCYTGSASTDPARHGGCDRGILNPAHRGVVDLPGRRFRLDGQVTLDLFVEAMAQF